MKFKKYAVLLLAVCLAVSIWSLGVSATETQSSDTQSGTMGNSITWTLDSEGTLTLTGTGSTSYGLSSGVKDSIKNVVVTSGITDIGPSTFSYCTNMESVSLPYGLQSIGSNAFAGCDSLKSVAVPYGVSAIYANAFESCDALATVTLPTTLRSLYDGVFGWCPSLTSINLPAYVETISGHPFAGCTALSSITIDANNSYFEVGADGCVYNQNMNELVLVLPSLTGNYTVRNSVTTIRQYAFRSSKVDSIVVPEGVTTISSYAFYCCSAKTITLPTSLKTIGSYAFSYSGLTSMELPSGITSIPGSAFDCCASLTSVSIPNTVTAIYSSAFSYCRALKSITIPSSVRSISDYAFSSCTALRAVFFEGNVPTFYSNTTGSEAHAFYNVKATVYTPANNLTWTENNKLNYSGNLTWTTVADSGACGDDLTWRLDDLGTLVIEGSGAMTDYSTDTPAPWDADAVRSVVFYGDISYIGQYAFSNCPSLVNVTIPATVKSIGGLAFQNCTGLQFVIFEGIRPTMNQYVFYGVTAKAYCPTSWGTVSSSAFGGQLTWTAVQGSGKCGPSAFWVINASNELHIFGSGATYNWDYSDQPWESVETTGEIETFVVEEGITHLGDYTLYSTNYVSSVSLPAGLVSIGKYVFSYTNVEELTIPSTVTYVDTGAFGSAYSLKRVWFEGNAPTFNGDVFPSYLSIGLLYPYGDTTWNVDVFSAVADASLDAELHWYAYDTNGIRASGDCGDALQWELNNGTLTISGSGNMTSYSYNSVPWAMVSDLIEEIILPEGLTKIGSYAFANATKITDIDIPETVTVIGDYAFRNAKSLTEIDIPDAVTYIGNYAFGSSSLSQVVLPPSVTTLGASAFAYNTNLKLAVIQSPLSMSNYTFSGCSALEEIRFMTDVPTFSSIAFGSGVTVTAKYPANNTTWTAAALQNYGATAVTWEAFTGGTCGENAFWYLDENGVLTISGRGDMDSYDIYGGPWDPTLVKKVVVEQGVTSIGANAFRDHTKLESIELPEGLTWIGGGAFQGCSALKEIEIPTTVTDIFTSFQGCTSLTEIILPEGITRVNSGMFRGCTALENVEIPSTVTEIGSYAFYDCSGLQNITIPDTVTVIGEAAFADSGLTEVSLPAGMTTLQNSVFMNCRSLKTVALPNGLTAINYTVFDNCVTLESITIPENVKSIGEGAFRYCTSLTNITLPTGLRSIGEQAFAYSNTLTEITLPGTVTSISQSAFYECTALETVNIPAGVTALNPCTFYNCTSLANVTLSEGLKTIGISVFENCGLTEITIPSSVTEISDLAFSGCTGLSKINFSGAAPTTIGSSAFTGVTATAYYPLSETSWTNAVLQNYGGKITWLGFDGGACGENAEWTYTTEGDLIIFGTGNVTSSPWSKYADDIRTVVVEEGITSLCDYALYYCPRITSVSLPSTLKTIGSNTFAYTDRLTAIELPEGLESMGNYAFAHSGIQSISIPDGITSIGEFTFSDCKALTSVEIPESVTFIGKYAFIRCSKLESIVIPSSVEMIDSSAFNSCMSLTSVTLSNGLKTIGLDAFSACYKLSEIVIPNSVTTIGADAFNTCDLTSVVISDNVKYLEAKTFANNMHLASVKLPANLLEIGTGCFSSCGALTSIDLPESLEYIGASAFGNTGLTSITIPADVETIGDTAFAECSSLTEIYFEGSAPAIGENAFRGVAATAYYWQDETWTSDVMQQYGGEIKWIAGGGVCGETAYWSFAEDGTLTIYGTGEMYNYDFISIPPWAAYEYDIAKVIVKDGVTSVGNYAFQDYEVLTAVDLADSVDRIGNDAFHGCVSLKTVNMPETMTAIDSNAFNKCVSLESIVVPEGVEVIGGGAFAQCSKMTSVTLSSTLKMLNMSAFENSGLTSVELPDGLTTIGDSAFYGTPITEINIPDSVTSIGTYAFFKCKNLASIVIPAGVSAIESKTFAECTALESVVLREGLKKIGNYAFDRAAFTSITIPASVKFIGTSAINGMNLTEVFFTGDAPQISDTAFQNASAELKITAYYPQNNETWTEDVMLDYGADITWYHDGENTVTFLDHEGNVISTETYFCGETITAPDPVIPSSDMAYRYTFIGWDPEFSEICVEDVTYAPVYESEYNEYTVIFKNYDGTVLSSKTYHYGDQVAEPAEPTRPADDTYSYTFTGWNKEIVQCDGDATYTAVYEAQYIDYTVKFENYDGTVLSSETYHYGDQVAEPAVPTRPADDTYSYTFTGWDKDVVPCSGDTTYVAVFEAQNINYTVTFVNYDGTVLSSETYRYGNQVVEPAAPTRAADETFTYSFAGWDEYVVPCNGDATYTAVYEAQYIDYTVTFANYDGTVLSSKTYHYGDTITVPDTIPQRDADVVGTYVFTGWNQEVSDTCTGSVVYLAEYEIDVYNEYTIVFYDRDGRELGSGMYYYGETIKYPKNPSGYEDDTHVYTFTGWYPAKKLCDGDLDIYAQYSAAAKLRITEHPADVSCAKDEEIRVSVTAYGDGLTYAWYYMDPGSTTAVLDSTCTDATYTATMCSETDGRQVYCIVTDQYGNSAQTSTATFTMTVIKTGWVVENGHTYYYDANGIMQTGWLQLEGSWYYLQSDGAMATGWTQAGGSWYYMNASGVMQTGWLELDGKWYFLQSGGAMATGWIQAGSSWYYMNASGVMQTGWLQLDGKWYYLQSGGAMATGWVQTGSNWYYMNASGVMQTGWLKDGNYWYYLNSGGVMVTGTQVIDGKSYTFNSSGVWVA